MLTQTRHFCGTVIDGGICVAVMESRIRDSQIGIAAIQSLCEIHQEFNDQHSEMDLGALPINQFSYGSSGTTIMRELIRIAR